MTLYLTLNKKWFDMIASGIKKEEYREIKPYWENRLVEKNSPVDEPVFRKFTEVIFCNGYRKEHPTVKVEVLNVSRGTGRPEWGAQEGMNHFIISLGNIINNQNQCL